MPGANFPDIHIYSEVVLPVLFGAGHEHLSAGGGNFVEEREEALAAAGIEFAHDVINEKNGHDSMFL